MATQAEVDGFHQFASEQIAGGGDLSMDELYCLWRAQQTSDAEIADSVAAVKAAWADFQAGDAGRPARPALREACERLGLVVD